MWQYNYSQPPDELMHYGKKGMKWGKRRAVRKQFDIDQRKLISEKDKIGVKKSGQIQKHMSEAQRLTTKYKFDQDDGGGGTSKKKLKMLGADIWII